MEKEETLQQAPFGGNISGRRLRGVKINPIYQENDHVGQTASLVFARPGPSAAAELGPQGEAVVVPIGEIQIEVYESLPRRASKKCSKSSTSAQHFSDPQLARHRCEDEDRKPAAGPGLRKAQVMARDRWNGRTTSEEVTGRSAEPSQGEWPSRVGSSRRDKAAAEGQGDRNSNGSGGRSSALGGERKMGVDNLPWTFLRETYQARREPIWGAFPGLDDIRRLKHKQDPLPEPEMVIAENSVKEISRNLSSEKINSYSSPPDAGRLRKAMEKLLVERATKEGEVDDADVNVQEHSVEGVALKDALSCSNSCILLDQKVQHDNPSITLSRPGLSESDTCSIVAEPPLVPPLSPVFPLPPPPSPRKLFPPIMHLPPLGNKGSDETSGCLRDPGFSNSADKSHGPLRSENEVAEPDESHSGCFCPCHTQSPPCDLLAGRRGTDNLSQNSSESGDDRSVEVYRFPGSSFNAHVCIRGGSLDSYVDPRTITQPSESEDIKHSRSLSDVKQDTVADTATAARGLYHQHSEECYQDLENNNNCQILSSNRQTMLSPADSVESDKSSEIQHSRALPDNLDFQSERNMCRSFVLESSSSNDSDSEYNGSNNNSANIKQIVKRYFNSDGTGEYCQQCGCPRLPGSGSRLQNGRLKMAQLPESAKTEAYLHTPRGLSSLLSTDAIILKAEDLNTPTYLQRYLIEAQRNYLQHHQQTSQQKQQQQSHPQLQHQLRILQDDLIITDASSTTPSPTHNRTPSTTSCLHASNVANSEDNLRAFKPGTQDRGPAAGISALSGLVFPGEFYDLPSFLIPPSSAEYRDDLSSSSLSGDCLPSVEDFGCFGLRSKSSSALSKNVSKPSIAAGTGSKTTSKQSSRTNSRQNSRKSRSGKNVSKAGSSIEDLEAEAEASEDLGSQWGSSSVSRNGSVTGSEGGRKNGVSVIQIPGTSSDPAFEMIVPYDEELEEESSYASRRRQRREELSGQGGWKDGNTTRDRVVKALICSLLFALIVGVFIGVAIHFGKDSVTATSGLTDSGKVVGGGSLGLK